MHEDLKNSLFINLYIFLAIMASGKIKCCGSSMFLKKHFGIDTNHFIQFWTWKFETLTKDCCWVHRHRVQFNCKFGPLLWFQQSSANNPWAYSISFYKVRSFQKWCHWIRNCVEFTREQFISISCHVQSTTRTKVWIGFAGRGNVFNLHGWRIFKVHITRIISTSYRLFSIMNDLTFSGLRSWNTHHRITRLNLTCRLSHL